MNNLVAAVLELSRLCRTECLTASGIVSRTPGYVFGVHVCPEDGAALYAAELYNGVSAIEELKLSFEAQYAADQWINSVPLYFSKGLYIACTTNIKNVTIQYLSCNE